MSSLHIVIILGAEVRSQRHAVMLKVLCIEH
jgi:hypothetical protein